MACPIGVRINRVPLYIGFRPFCWKNKVVLRIFNFLNGHAPPILWPTPAANWHLHCIDLAQASIIPEWLSWIDRAWLLYTGFLLVFVRQKHRRTGRGARGAAAPPKFWATQLFLGCKRKFGQSLFLKTSSCLFNYFEDLNINLKSA